MSIALNNITDIKSLTALLITNKKGECNMYHYNPKTGEVSKCKAKSPETYPFGAENHA